MTSESDQTDPWIESPEGSLFFVNVLLVTPELVVLLPLALGSVLRGLGMVDGPSQILDPIPAIAAAALPFVGWLLAIPVWTTAKSLRTVRRPWPRVALTIFLVIHLSFLIYTVLAWSRALGG